MDDIIIKIERTRESSVPMLITRETGTGKELIARAVHTVSALSEREFIPFNCGGSTPELIASEFFGYQKGAFTGAVADRKGAIREADGGTLFLDEIGEMPTGNQAMLLRCLEQGEVRSLGQTRPVKVKVRVIAATNRDLKAGRFREDLFHRISALWLRIPPLRERREDIPLLIDHFFRLHTQETGKQGVRLSDEAWALMIGHHWPGNAREVKNVLERLVAFAGNGDVIGPERFLEEIGISDPPPAAAMVDGKFVIDFILSYTERQKELERLSIIHDLNETGGNITQTAKSMRKSRNYLKKRIKQYGIKTGNHGQPQAK